jgi:hypothetical protein
MKVVLTILFVSSALFLVACNNDLPHVSVEADNHTPEVIDEIPQHEQDEPLSQENEQPEPIIYELCDCGMFFAHEIEEFDFSSPSSLLRIRDVEPPGPRTHFTYQFETVHTAALVQCEVNYPNYIVLWADEPIYDFSFVSVHHNAICCAYVGDVLLAVDRLDPRDAVLLTVAFAHYLFPRAAVIYTDSDGTQHREYIFQNMMGGCAPGFFLYPTNGLIDSRDNWLDLGIISIPGTFAYDKTEHILITTSCMFVSGQAGQDVWDLANKMWVGYLHGEYIRSMLEKSLATTDFLFDDGHKGYSLELDDELWWVRPDGMAVSFRHGGYRLFFEMHERLILEIARTLISR